MATAAPKGRRASSGRRWVTIQDVAEHLGVTTKTVRTMIADGRLRAYRNGVSVIRLDMNEVDDAMEPMTDTDHSVGFGRAR
jgi:excisionase family DNA binding protein